MDKQALATIEMEMAILIRQLTSMATTKKFGNLDRSAYLLLHQMTAHGSAGVKALAGEFHLDISTVSRQVSALEQKGYVLRMPDPEDGRANLFQITELGRQELDRSQEERMRRIAQRLKGWTEEERATFGELLQKFNEGFR
ncbi:MAG TPA: MarR family transcriptional regulator [Bacilli bacterium]|nr:MarR family transcriptional regulator [Bacilli bacterium]